MRALLLEERVNFELFANKQRFYLFRNLGSVRSDPKHFVTNRHTLRLTTMEQVLNPIVSYIGPIVGVYLGATVLVAALKALTRSKNFAAPRLTMKGHIANWLLWPETLLKRKPEHQALSLEALQKEATRKTKRKGNPAGLTDFGEKWYETPYKHAVEMVKQKRLSPLG